MRSCDVVTDLYMKAQKWSGNLPTVTGGAMPMIQIK